MPNLIQSLQKMNTKLPGISVCKPYIHPNMTKEVIYEVCKKHVNSNFYTQLKYIIYSVPVEFLKDLDTVLSEKRSSNIVCLELDMIATKGRYFGYLELSKLAYGPDFNISFGMDFNDIPDLIARWRDEKINHLGL